MKNALAAPAMMAPTLREFLQRVYGNPTIMKGPNNVAGLIYDLYAKSGVAGVPTSMRIAREFFLSIWRLSKLHPVLKEGKLQYTGVSLEEMAQKCQQSSDVPPDLLKDFLYFEVNDVAATYRLYLNVKVLSIPVTISRICGYIKRHSKHGIVDFKAAGPVAAPSRADSIVVYCVSRTAAEKLGEHLLTFPDCFNATVPEMTSRLHPQLGAALGAEPKQQATGMQKPPKGYKESAQSFGTIRSQLIAMAIVNYNANRHVYGTGFDVFARFVCAAFRGYGLDPMNPGD